MCRKKLLTAVLCVMTVMSAHMCVNASEVGALDGDMPPVPGAETQIETVEEESEAETGAETPDDMQEEDVILGEEDESESESEDDLSMEIETFPEETETETETEQEVKIVEVTQYALSEDIVPVPETESSTIFVTKEYRFTQVDKQYAVVSRREGCSVYEGQGDIYRTVGELPYYGICYILDDEDEDWVYIESGNVRGFVDREDITTGEVADRIVSVRGEDELSEARLTLSRIENAAFTYTTTTVNEVMADKDYAIAEGGADIYEQKKTDSRVTGHLPEGGLCYVLEDAGEGWLYVESGDARGFVPSDALVCGDGAESQVAENGEDSFATAEVLVQPDDNRACYYTLTSVKEASQSQTLRESMVNFALQFVGNPYVWGGTSLTNGADCSGFVQSIYANYGYYIPRVTWDQAAYSQRIPISEAQPGDLIFYSDGSTIYHVSMYIGNGCVVQAANSRAGIITSGIGGNAVYAGRILPD